MLFAPFINIMDQMEFRIYQIIFCNLFKIRLSVPFDDYVTLVFDKYILSLIKIKPLVRLQLFYSAVTVFVTLSVALYLLTGLGGAHCDAHCGVVNQELDRRVLLFRKELH